MESNEPSRRKKIRARDVFETFFLKHHQDDIINILEADDEEEHYSIIMNFLTLFEEHVEVAESLLGSPVKLLPVMDTGLVCAVTKVMEQVREEKKDITMKTNLHARITGLPTCPELYRHAVPRTCDVGRLLCVTGTIVRTTSVKMLEYQKQFICSKCKHVFTVKADHDQYYQLSKPGRCPNPDDCYSNNFSCLGDSSHPLHTKDYQEVKIQEQVQKLVVGTIPRSLWVTLEDDLVDLCKPGDDVLLCGTVHRRWHPVARDTRPDIDLVLKANNVTVRNKQRTGAVVTDEMREEFSSFWEQHQFDPLTARNILLASFCPQVYGLYVVKLAVAVVVAGGVQKTDNSCTRIRGDSHLLLVGDPGTGKSQFLKYVCQLAPRCVLTTGIGTTNAGLTVTAVRDEGEWALEAGALVLADGGICCIDEFSNVREADRAAIHEAMEQQTISVAKAGMVCKLNSRCSIIAATNPKGQYDPDESLIVNVALASPLLSRFDLILVLLDTKNPEWDRIVSGYILEGRDPLAGDGGSKDDWSLEKLQVYFCHIRSLQPIMTASANTILSRYYQVQRQSDQSSKARTTIRLLESLVRLSQGHARLMMRMEVTIQDAVMAVTLMEASMCGASIITGINPLHTAFPHSPKDEYKNQAKIMLQKLGLFDILSEEMTRLNQQEKLYASCQTSRPKDVMKEKNSKEDIPVTTKYCQKRDFKSSYVEEGAAPNIEELEENEHHKWPRRRKQQSLPQMTKKMESGVSESEDPEFDVSFSSLINPSPSNTKSTKAKTSSKKKTTVCQVQKENEANTVGPNLSDPLSSSVSQTHNNRSHKNTPKVSKGVKRKVGQVDSESINSEVDVQLPSQKSQSQQSDKSVVLEASYAEQCLDRVVSPAGNDSLGSLERCEEQTSETILRTGKDTESVSLDAVEKRKKVSSQKSVTTTLNDCSHLAEEETCTSQKNKELMESRKDIERQNDVNLDDNMDFFEGNKNLDNENVLKETVVTVVNTSEDNSSDKAIKLKYNENDEDKTETVVDADSLKSFPQLKPQESVSCPGGSRYNLKTGTDFPRLPSTPASEKLRRFSFSLCSTKNSEKTRDLICSEEKHRSQMKEKSEDNEEDSAASVSNRKRQKDQNVEIDSTVMKDKKLASSFSHSENRHENQTLEDRIFNGKNSGKMYNEGHSKTTVKDILDTGNEVCIPHIPNVSGSEKPHLVLPLKKPLFMFGSTAISSQSSPIFSKCMTSHFGTTLASDELDDVDFEL